MSGTLVPSFKRAQVELGKLRHLGREMAGGPLGHGNMMLSQGVSGAVARTTQEVKLPPSVTCISQNRKSQD